jgi:hypothetical protein
MLYCKAGPGFKSWHPELSGSNKNNPGVSAIVICDCHGMACMLRNKSKTSGIAPPKPVKNTELLFHYKFLMRLADFR